SMPSPSDSSSVASGSRGWSDSRRGMSARGSARLLLYLGLCHLGLGAMVLAFSFTSMAFTSSARVRQSCPFWAGFFDLLFSACGLSILSTIICTLSTVTCSIHIFSLDLVHLVRLAHNIFCSFNAPLLRTPFSLTSWTLRSLSLQSPHPVLSPEYTCSSETDAQSITYNGSMESPVPLYPTDCPPPYEAVMGQRAASQVGQDLHEFCHIKSVMLIGSL
uniref:Uncharacterized protein n=1 Tax=Neogobius melanostomus TaxID=47308 RepID=A0A8C6TNV6_9GOBI